MARLDWLMNANTDTLTEVFKDAVIAIGGYVHTTGVDDKDLETLSLMLNAQILRFSNRREGA